MRDILIILLSVLFTLLVIVLFDIQSMSQQFLTLVFVLLAFIVFYMAIDKIHIFKDSENEVNINNTTFNEDGDVLYNDNALEMELSEEEDVYSNNNQGQNLVEAEDEKYNLNSSDLIDLNFTIKNLDTNNFGTVNSNSPINL
jgi:hypothetical protein